MKTQKRGSEKSYRALNGCVIRYSSSSEVDSFLEFLSKMLSNSETTEEAMIAFAFGRTNPMLRGSIEAAIVYGEVLHAEFLSSPLFKIISDLILRKRIETVPASDHIAEKFYTIAIPEAADALGVSATSLRNAVKSGKIPGRKIGSKYYLPEGFMDRMRHQRKAKPALLHVHTNRNPNKPTGMLDFGHALRMSPELQSHALDNVAFKQPIELKPGQLRIRHHVTAIQRTGTQPSFHVKFLGTLENLQEEWPFVEGNLSSWTRVALLSGSGVQTRYFELEPLREAEGKLEWDGGFVRGSFRVAKKSNNRAKGVRLFEAFVPK